MVGVMEETLSLRQEDRAVGLLQERGMARLSEFIKQDITAATISRMERKGALIQLSRGLYQLPYAPLDANHTLAEAAKLVPKGVICLSSALAFHELTDQIPASVWVAIGTRDWRPKIAKPNVQIMRFGRTTFDQGIQLHMIEKVPVRIYSPAKTVVDLFYSGRLQKSWYGSEVGLTEAVQGLKEALRQKKATPAEIARYSIDAKIWEKVVQPRLETLTIDA